MILRLAVVVTLLLMAAVPFGPAVEVALFPAVSVTPSIDFIEREGLGFTLTGKKNRNCPLDRLTFAWRFDSTALVADVYEDRNGKPFRAPETIVAGESFVFGPLYAPLPPPVYSQPEARLQMSFDYRCGPWVLKQDFELSITVPPAPAALRQQSARQLPWFLAEPFRYGR